MVTPSSPELARSGHTPVDPDTPAATAPLEPDVATVGAAGHAGPVPPGNQPVRTDGDDQDKPDLAAFARRLGIRRPHTGDAQATRPDAGDDHGDTDEGGEPMWRRLATPAAGVASTVLRAAETALRRSADLAADLADKLGDDDRGS